MGICVRSIPFSVSLLFFISLSLYLFTIFSFFSDLYHSLNLSIILFLWPFFLSLDLLHFLSIIPSLFLLPFGHLNEHGLLMESRESTSSPSMSPTLSIIPSTFPASPSVSMSSRRSRVFPQLRASTCHSTNKHTTRPHIAMLSLPITRLHAQCCYGYVYCPCLDR